MSGPVLFDDMEKLLRELVQSEGSPPEGLGDLIAVRDLFGRIRFVLEKRPEDSFKEKALQKSTRKALEDFAKKAKEKLGPRAYPPDQAFLYRGELASDVASELDAAREIATGPPRLLFLDRQVTGLGWATTPSQQPQGVHRIAFFSLKGGVGRSTSVAAAAWHLAREGRQVLVLDLDLEAPGLSSSLLPAAQLPDFGIVDWFVEDAVGQGEVVLQKMAAASPLAQDLDGQLWVAPSHGRLPGDYLAKLGRCYLDLPQADGDGHEPWENRLVRLIESLEKEKKPDVVLIDVRAGLADLSSVPVTDLGADVLLFALDTDQTWAGYRLLFEHWRRTETIRALRERLQVVAALVPETERAEYLDSFRENAWSLFSESVYDEVPPDYSEAGGASEPFNFDLTDESAPHAPIPIYWHRGLASLRNLHTLDDHLASASFGKFLDIIDKLLEAGTEDPS
ncbi:ParA family protein [Oceanithermus sp.]